VGELSPWHWAIVILIAVLLFGSRRLPDAARSLGRSARILKAELREGAATPTSDEQSRPEQRPAPAPPREAPRGELRDGSTAPATPGEPQHAELREGSTTTPAASEPLHPEEHR
jgi:sec-independent protein translocase protein TatA